MAGEGLVELVEAGKLEGEEVDATIGPLLDRMLGTGCDVIVLGCTHYPFLRRAIREYAGEGVQIIDSGTAIARRTLSVLQMDGLLRERTETGTFRLLTNANSDGIAQVASQLLGRPITVCNATP